MPENNTTDVDKLLAPFLAVDLQIYCGKSDHQSEKMDDSSKFENQQKPIANSKMCAKTYYTLSSDDDNESIP